MLKQYELKNYSFKLIINVFVLCALGTVFINVAKSEYLPKQIFGLIACSTILIITSLIDYNFIARFSWFLYGFNVFLLVTVKLFGLNVNGATRWFKIPGFGTFQPSELTKIIMIIFVADFIARHQDDLNTFKTLLKLAILCAIPIGLIAIQTDLSTSIDITLILLAIIFIGGISYKIILTALAIFTPLTAFGVWYLQTPNQKLLQGYQLKRILAFIDPKKYQDAEAYQQNNSVMAIGSGQLFGKGIHSDSLATVKDANLVSEQQTDFIFSIVGEMMGFVGCVIVVTLLAFIVFQCISISRKAKDTQGMLIAVGFASLIAFQSFINIGVATQLLPNTGLPLPFVSYGLSSLLSASIGIGLVLNIGLQKRKY